MANNTSQLHKSSRLYSCLLLAAMFASFTTLFRLPQIVAFTTSQRCEILKAGIPQQADYDSLFRTYAFRKVERFSDNFQYKHRKVLEVYGKKWVTDPLHTWSRVYEYPFVFCRVMKAVAATSTKQFRILDLGSGVTFFPWLIKEFLGDKTASVSAVDVDVDFTSLYDTINHAEHHQVSFRAENMKMTLENTPAGHYDIIYSISVLEHVDDALDMIEKVERALKKGGIFIVTIDVYDDDSPNQFQLKRAENIIQTLNETFIRVGPIQTTLRDGFNANPVVPETYRLYNKDYDSASFGPHKLTFSCFEFMKS